ncbi:MAG TPA: hypothetical protein GXX17_03475 [Clostridiales bacterium]|nr:hypothetical protein [Clostridiales bacterium]
MPVQEKLYNFVSAITKEAERKRQQIQQETKDYISAELEKAENEALYESYHLIQNSISQIRNEIWQEVSEKVLEYKYLLIERRNEIWREVFNLVERRVKDFAGSEKYEEFLKKAALQAYNLLSGKVTVYIRPEDKKFEDLIKSILPECEIVVDNTIEFGGIKMAADGSKIIDNTLDTRIKTECKQFTNTRELIIS